MWMAHHQRSAKATWNEEKRLLPSTILPCSKCHFITRISNRLLRFLSLIQYLLKYYSYFIPKAKWLSWFAEKSDHCVSDFTSFRAFKYSYFSYFFLFSGNIPIFPIFFLFFKENSYFFPIFFEYLSFFTVILSLILLSMIFYFKKVIHFVQSILKFFLTLLNLACPHVCTRIKLLFIVCGESGWLLRDVFRSI